MTKYSEDDVKDFMKLIHNLDPANELHMEIYKKVRYKFIEGNERADSKVYHDSRKNATIGNEFLFAKISNISLL